LPRTKLSYNFADSVPRVEDRSPGKGEGPYGSWNDEEDEFPDYALRKDRHSHPFEQDVDFRKTVKPETHPRVKDVVRGYRIKKAVKNVLSASQLPTDDTITHVNTFGIGWPTDKIDGTTPKGLADNPSRLGPHPEDSYWFEDEEADHSEVPRDERNLVPQNRGLSPRNMWDKDQRWTDPTEGVDYQNSDIYDDWKIPLPF